MHTIIHKADTRGHANHGWLDSYHTFSFARYYNPQRMGVGQLIVINDDTVAPSQGFGTHSHQDMEIISLPLLGSIKHKDTMGNEAIIKYGEVQIMSAGSGISHSEYNACDKIDTNFLQIWIKPKELNIAPRYAQKQFDMHKTKNNFHIVVSGDKEATNKLESDSIWINQDAYLSLANIEQGQKINYSPKLTNATLYFFIIHGSITINQEELMSRDGMAITEIENNNINIEVQAQKDAYVLCIETLA